MTMTAEEFRTDLKELKIRQRELAIILGISVTTVNRWAKDLLPVPKYCEIFIELLLERDNQDRYIAVLEEMMQKQQSAFFEITERETPPNEADEADEQTRYIAKQDRYIAELKELMQRQQ